MEPEVMVTCPLCKVTTSEKEIVDNLFLNPENSRNGEKDADMPETHMCESCDEGHFGNFQYMSYSHIVKFSMVKMESVFKFNFFGCGLKVS